MQKMEAVPKPIPVLYILGMGRSGSTLLNIILGNHAQAASFGDLIDLTYQGWILDKAVCSCSQHANACTFWSEVKQLWMSRAKIDEVADYAALQKDFEHMRSIPRLQLERWKPSARFKKYAVQTALLLESIISVSGKPYIVDASKTPGRALALSMIPHVDLKVVHLVRDVRGVAFSKKKPHDPTSVYQSAASWVAVNLLSTRLGKKLGPEKFLRVHYENLAADPKKTLADIGSLTGLSTEDLSAAVTEGQSMRINHVIGGNRIRMAESITLKKADRAWTTGLTSGERLAVSLIAGWLMRIYGFE